MVEYPELNDLMGRIKSLSHLEKNLIMLYAIKGGQGEVRIPASELAENLGIMPQALSRVRKKLEHEGWLELLYKIDTVGVYRLGEKATGHAVVIQLHA